jgi:hypothetical protein
MFLLVAAAPSRLPALPWVGAIGCHMPVIRDYTCVAAQQQCRRVKTDTWPRHKCCDPEALLLLLLWCVCRCNQQGRIGFVSDRRRLNVAITRPRRGLVVVCSPETLEKGSDDWAAFMSWCRERQWFASPRIVPAAPWQLQGLDPFAAGQGDGVSSLSSAEDAR